MDRPWAKHYTVVGPRTQRPRGTALASGTTPTWVAHGAALVPHRVLLLSALALGRDTATQDQKEDAGHLEEGMRVEGEALSLRHPHAGWPRASVHALLLAVAAASQPQCLCGTGLGPACFSSLLCSLPDSVRSGRHQGQLGLDSGYQSPDS